MSVDVVRGHLQAYDWGPVDGLAGWTPATGGPQAELWFGSHPNGPSRLRATGATATTPMPILTKLLAAARPLSIQIHPPADMADALYEAQSADPGLPRLLSDPHPKTEILIALEPFVILLGLRPMKESAAVLGHLGEQLDGPAAALVAGDVRAAIRGLLAVPDEQVSDLIDRLPASAAAAGLPRATVEVIQEVARDYPGDRGVLVALLLNDRTVEPGQAVYVEPGTVHAYVRGTGVEVMTNSDNVLRLGLTGKTVAVDAALAALSVTARPELLDPPEIAGVRTYAPAGAPFEVRLLRSTEFAVPGGAACTVVCLQGSARVGGQTLAPGDGMLIPAGGTGTAVFTDGLVVLAQHLS
ncbi:MAG TPA: mannose-6-phosphate isomerase, class I [Actinomycetota bacterium]|nr:mannose-6-phosphate isomerase, class I [Actinomycetota bacterium]